MALYIVLLVLITVLVLLVTSRIKPAWIFTGAVVLCYLLDLISVPQLMGHFSNLSLLTMVLLLLVSTAIEKSRLIAWLSRQFSRGSQRSVIAKLGFSTALLSSFLNNTAVVASLMGAIKRNPEHAPSRLLLPLSYAAIFGGTLTLIGTSTNLIVNSFVVEAGLPPLHFFEFSAIGLAGLIAGMAALLLLCPTLPHHKEAKEQELPYLLEARLSENSALIGQSVASSHLRGLKKLYLAEIKRGDKLICPVSPDEILERGDLLLFCGDPDGVVLLQEIDGLELFGQQQLNGQHLVEVIVSASSKLQGKTLKESRFRDRYNAVVVAVRRGDESPRGGMGNIRLQPGDSLILAPGNGFWQAPLLRQEFILLNGLDASTRLDPVRSFAVIAAFALVIALSLFEVLPLFKGLLLMLIGLIASKTLHIQEVKRRLPWEIWLIIGSALTLAQLMTDVGLAARLGEFLLHTFSGVGVITALIATYLATLLLTELITNNAAAALAFPVALSLSQSFGVSPMPFIMAVIFGASASFISPYGYQTNLMVFNAGGYHFRDYLKMGVPTTIAYSAAVLVAIVHLFPF